MSKNGNYFTSEEPKELKTSDKWFKTNEKNQKELRILNENGKWEHKLTFDPNTLDIKLEEN